MIIKSTIIRKIEKLERSFLDFNRYYQQIDKNLKKFRLE